MARILVFSKDAREANTRALLFEFAGHRCETATCLDEAMELLCEDSFDLLITEAGLAYHDGNRIVKKMKTASPGLAVMILSKKGGIIPEDADDLLTVPCSAERLLRRIEDLLERHFQQDSGKCAVG